MSFKFPTIPINFMRHPVGLLEGWFFKLILIALMLWVLWIHISPQIPEASPVLKKAVNERLPALVSDVSAKAAAIHAGRIVVLHLAKDDSEYVTAAIRTALFDKGVGQQPDRSWGEKTRDLIGLNPVEYGQADKAIATAKSMGADAVIFGTVRQAGSDLALDLRLGDVKTGQAVELDSRPPQPPVAETAPPADGSRKAAARDRSFHVMPILRQILIWAVVALLLPVFSIEMIRATVRRESNTANFFTLGVYTLADAFILVLLLLGRLDVDWTLLVVALGGVAAVFYNASLMTWVVRQRGLVGS